MLRTGIPSAQNHNFTFDGHAVAGQAGDTVADAVLAAGHGIFSRSLKYHRPRGVFCMDGHCSGCLVRIDGVPNLRACVEKSRAGMVVETQNALPNAEHDVLGVVDRFFSRGLNHHTLMTSNRLLNAISGKVVRQLSGLGTLPSADAMDATAQAVVCDILVVGGGPAGMAAAVTAAKTSAKVCLVDEKNELGGRFAWEIGTEALFRQLVAEVSDSPVQTFLGATAIGYFPDQGGVVAVATASTLMTFRARATIYSTGGYAQNLGFLGNDRPGVISARAAGLLLRRGFVLGSCVALVGESSAASWLMPALTTAGTQFFCVAQSDVRRVHGTSWVEAISFEQDGKERKETCDLVIVLANPTPASECARQQGAAVRFDWQRGGFIVEADDTGQTNVPSLFVAGEISGAMTAQAAEQHGRRVGQCAVQSLAKESEFHRG